MYESNSGVLAATGLAVPSVLGAVLAPQLFFQIIGLSVVAISVLFIVFKRRNV